MPKSRTYFLHTKKTGRISEYISNYQLLRYLRAQNMYNTESKEYQVAMDRAIKNVEQQMVIKQQMLQAGNAAAGGAAGAGAGAGGDAKVKQEGTAGTGAGAAGSGATANTGAASKGTPKSTAKRRKKSEEASAAAASMGINTNVAAASQSRGPPSAGVTPGGPSTPTSAPVKRRKKTKNVDPK